jgi:hypothetical protein
MARQLLDDRRQAPADSQERPTMSATCQNSLTEAIATPPLRSSPAYLFQGTSVTAAFLKMKVFLHAFKTKSSWPPPSPGDQEDPPQSGEREDWRTDPMLWMLMFH